MFDGCSCIVPAFCADAPVDSSISKGGSWNSSSDPISSTMRSLNFVSLDSLDGLASDVVGISGNDSSSWKASASTQHEPVCMDAESACSVCMMHGELWTRSAVKLLKLAEKLQGPEAGQWGLSGGFCEKLALVVLVRMHTSLSLTSAVGMWMCGREFRAATLPAAQITRACTQSNTPVLMLYLVVTTNA